MNGASDFVNLLQKYHFSETYINFVLVQAAIRLHVSSLETSSSVFKGTLVQYRESHTLKLTHVAYR